jgi:[ribosomal protein S5]-alanine N-acetyltransferase
MEIPTPEPPLAEGDVTLRPWGLEDAPVLARAWADPAIRRWCSVPDDCSLEGAERWIAGSAQCRADGLALDLAIVSGGCLAGEVGLGPIQWSHRRAAVGFWLDAEHRRNNLAAKALRLLSDWALDNLPLDTLAGEASTENPASGWTLKAAGFTLVTERNTRQAWIRAASPT